MIDPRASFGGEILSDGLRRETHSPHIAHARHLHSVCAEGLAPKVRKLPSFDNPGGGLEI